MSEELLDCLGRRRSPAATSVFHVGRSPRNRGLRYPADPPPVEEIVAVMRAAGPDVYGDRLRAIIVVLWRAGLRVGEALALARPILILRAGRCWSGGGRAANAGRSVWTRGGGARLTCGLRPRRGNVGDRNTMSRNAAQPALNLTGAVKRVLSQNAIRFRERPSPEGMQPL